MAVYNLGSINADHVYRVPHLPAPGETLAASEFETGLGGKGANQSVAAARAGARVFHIGAVGPDGGWARDRLGGFGVDAAHVAVLEVATGHAVINVDASGENAIVLFPGANIQLEQGLIEAALSGAGTDDILLMQNETSQQAFTAELARARGMRVIYSAAPFDVEAVRAVLPHLSVLALNEVEAGQLCAALGCTLDDVEVPATLVTKGADGAEWRERGGEVIRVPSIRVEPVDTTGAGDTFAGYMAAGLDAGLGVEAAMRRAAGASALMVTRKGAADAIPELAEVEAFLSGQE